jgi:GNAT superfamily N-acetyltransferase
MTLRLSLAHDHHLKRVIRLVDEAAAWLRHHKDTDQWARPWPTAAARNARIRADIMAGKTWLAWDGDIPVATITSEATADPLLSHEWDDDEPAAYVHRLVVARSHSGRDLGSNLLNWVGNRAAMGYGARWIRIDVWTTNTELHRYYLRNGFRFVRHCRDRNYPSGALFQKAIHEIAEVGAGLVEDIPATHPAAPWGPSMPLRRGACRPTLHGYPAHVGSD